MTNDTLSSLDKVIEDRRANPREGSYTSYLFEKGLDKTLKKIGEESAEVIIAAKNGSKEELCGEVCDLIFHLLVMMNQKNLPLDDVFAELESRSQKTGNLKELKAVDKNS